jgi:class 3 adenylate cyclase
MSWLDELAPPPLTPGALVADLRDAWRMYADAQLPLVDRLVFLQLRAGQRIAYGIGWNAGRRRAISRIPRGNQS